MFQLQFDQYDSVLHLFDIIHFVNPLLIEEHTHSTYTIIVAYPEKFIFEVFPVSVISLAEAPLHMTSCIQQRSMFLLVIVPTISLDLPLVVPIFHEAISNVFYEISHNVDLTGPFPVLPLAKPSTQFSVPFFQKNLLRTCIVFKLKQNFTTGSLS